MDLQGAGVLSERCTRVSHSLHPPQKGLICLGALLIDLFSLYVLFSLCRSRANTLENCFIQILFYLRAYVRIICEKIKGHFHLENIRHKLRRCIPRNKY